ncbi:MAG TPA: class I SAM-dependent methyltransferase [Nordella sp.]|nr:class I SAM-dependent methyltransferase [Nordella sp.]
MTVHTEIRPRVHARAAEIEAPTVDVPTRPALKRFIISQFERGTGAQLAAFATDTHFKLWRITHRGGSYAEFYAQAIAARMPRGGSRRTLGPPDYWTEFLPLSAARRDSSGFRDRGRKYFDWFLNRGLRRDMTCIDFGCGSLRVGQHFIDYLDTGRYLGLDIIDRFYRDGMSLIEGNVILRRQPRFLVINTEALERAHGARADLIFSTAVLQHVPPAEVARFLGNIIGLMHRDTAAIIHFRAAMATTRIAASTWTHVPISLISEISRIDPMMHTRIMDGVNKEDARSYRAVLVLSRNSAALGQWFPKFPSMNHPSISPRGHHAACRSPSRLHLPDRAAATAADGHGDAP